MARKAPTKPASFSWKPTKGDLSQAKSATNDDSQRRQTLRKAATVALIASIAVASGACSRGPSQSEKLEAATASQLFAKSPADAIVFENHGVPRQRDFPSGHIGGYAQKKYLTPKNQNDALDELLINLAAAHTTIAIVLCTPPGQPQPNMPPHYGYVSVGGAADFGGYLAEVEADVGDAGSDRQSATILIGDRTNPALIAATQSSVFIATSPPDKSDPPIKRATSLTIECDANQISDQRLRTLLAYSGPIIRKPPPTR